MRDGVIIVLLLVMLELFLQRFDPRYKQHLFDRDFTGGFPVAMNDAGYRGAMVSEEPTEGTLRLIGAGDSVTFGTGVPWDATWPHKAGEVLAESIAQPIDVINYGMAATSIAEIRYALEMEWLERKPDGVMLLASNNQVALAWLRRDFEDRMPVNGYANAGPATGLSKYKEQLNRIVKQYCLQAFFTRNAERLLYQVGLLDHELPPWAPFGPLLSHGWQQLNIDPNLPGEAWQEFENDLIELRDVCVAAEVPLVVTAVPARFMLTDRWVDNEKAVPNSRISIIPTDRFAAICERLDIPYVRTTDSLLAQRQEAEPRWAPLYIQTDTTHLDEDGHTAVGRAVADHLRVFLSEPDDE